MRPPARDTAHGDLRCFLCRTPLAVSEFSVMAQDQPEELVDAEGRAHFCSPCTDRIDAAIAETPHHAHVRRGLHPNLAATVLAE